MIRKTAGIIAVLLCIFVFASCNKKQEDNAETTTAEETATEYSADSSTVTGETEIRNETTTAGAATTSAVTGAATTAAAGTTTASAATTAGAGTTVTGTTKPAATTAAAATTAKAAAATQAQTTRAAAATQTTRANNNSAATTQAAATVNEYDVLRSNSFYLKGTNSSDGTATPVEIAKTSDSLYMLTNLDSISAGMMINGDNKIYLIFDDYKCYIEMSQTVLKYIGMDDGDIPSMSEFSFSDYPALSSAAGVNNSSVNGVSCKEYVLPLSDGGTLKVYMNGNRLLRFIDYDSAGSVNNYYDITSISATVPDNRKSIPSGYTGYKGVAGLLAFASKHSDMFS